jgi:hypothetical protein
MDLEYVCFAWIVVVYYVFVGNYASEVIDFL